MSGLPFRSPPRSPRGDAEHWQECRKRMAAHPPKSFDSVTSSRTASICASRAISPVRSESDSKSDTPHSTPLSTSMDTSASTRASHTHDQHTLVSRQPRRSFRLSPVILRIDADGPHSLPIDGGSHSQDNSPTRSEAMVTRRGLCELEVQPEAPHECAANAVLNALLSAYDPSTDAFRHQDKAALGGAVLRLCHHLTPHTGYVARPIVHLSSPVFVCGDLHGSFADLHYFFSQTVPFRAVRLQTVPALFLGDYVDRGRHSFEVVALLLAWHALVPDRVVLLRGNHEDPEVNGDIAQYCTGSFLHRCIELFDSSLEVGGTALWAAINAVFTYLPIAAIVDGSVFTCHGGVPRLHFASACGRQPSPPHQREPQQHSLEPNGFALPVTIFQRLLSGAIALPAFDTLLPVVSDSVDTAMLRRVVREVIWNDPAPSSADPQTFDYYGFRPNAARGDAEGLILEFSEQAVNTFLAEFSWSMVVRAHQHKRCGLHMSHGARVVTVFTSANYAGEDSAGACLIARASVQVVSWNRAATVAAATAKKQEGSSYAPTTDDWRDGRLPAPSSPLAEFDDQDLQHTADIIGARIKASPELMASSRQLSTLCSTLRESASVDRPLHSGRGLMTLDGAIIPSDHRTQRRARHVSILSPTRTADQKPTGEQPEKEKKRRSHKKSKGLKCG